MKQILAATVALTVASLVSPASAQWANHQAVRSSDFQASIGVNMHMQSEWDTAYSDAANGGAGWVGNNAATGPVRINNRTQTNVSKIVQAIWYTGAGHARVWISGYTAADRIQAVAQSVPWLKLDVQMQSTALGIWNQLNLAGPFAHMVEAIEGLNEAAENASYEGLYGAAADCRYQTELFGAVGTWNSQHGVNVPLLAPSVSGQNFNDFATMSSCAWAANAANAHIYTQNYGPTWKMGYDRQFWIKDAPNGAPIWASETGYATNNAAPAGLSEDVAAKRTLISLLTFFSNHIVRTYLYELVDENPQTPRLWDVGNVAELEDHFGIYNNDWSPKETARMLHSQLQLIADRSAGAYSFTPTSMWYQVANAPPATSSFLMQKGDGSFLLALWAEPSALYHSATAGSWGWQQGIPDTQVTLTFDRQFSKLQTADPFASGGDTPNVKWAGQYSNTITVPVSDHVIYLVLTP